MITGSVVLGCALDAVHHLLPDAVAKVALEKLFSRAWDEAGLHARAYLEHPANHDLERSLRCAALVACLALVDDQGAVEAAERYGSRGAPPDRFTPAARRWLHRQLRALGEVPAGVHGDSVALLAASLDTALVALRDRRDVAEATARRREAEAAMWSELAAALPDVPFPDGFEERFRGGDEPDHPGWFACFVAFLREALKDTPKARVAFFASGLSALKNAARRIEATQEEVARDVRAVRVAQDALPDAVSERVVAELERRGLLRPATEGGLERETILRLARRLRPEETLGLDQAVAALEQAVGVALGAVARGERGGNEDELVERVLAEAGVRTRRGEFDQAARAVEEGLAELERREAERQEALRRSRTALLEAGLAQDLLRRDAAGAARRVRAIVEAENPGGPAAWTPAFRERWREFLGQGEPGGVNFSLAVAAELARIMLAEARDDEERGTAWGMLGTALLILGDRQAGPAMLEEAITAFRRALEFHTREAAPLEWARAQRGLGAALFRLGFREGGTARLEEAVAEHRRGLEVLTRERDPAAWAAARHDLGLALRALGDREGGTARLEEAVAVLCPVLEVHTRERTPLYWAGTQVVLCTALLALGEREGGTARTEEAAGILRSVLKVLDRRRAPLLWARVQYNLGSALSTLAVRGGGAALAEEARVAYGCALEEWTRERTPLEWAFTTAAVGGTDEIIGDETGDLGRWREALERYEVALAEAERVGAAYNSAWISEARARVAAKLGDPISRLAP